MYCTATNEWTWMDNDTLENPAGSWGVTGVTDPANKPNGRSGNLLWSDNNGHLFSFGGSTANYNTPYQDIWKYNIDPACALCNTIPVAVFNAPNHICPGTCTDFINLSVNATSFQWVFPGAIPGTSTDPSPTGICYNTPGNYGVTLIATNANGNDTLFLPGYITVYPYPAPQGILQSGDTLFANQGAVSYQWYFNGAFISGATNYFYVALQSGNYNVVATDANHCEVEAVIFDVIAGLEALAGGNPNGLSIFPNPADDKITIQAPGLAGSQFNSSVYQNETAPEISIYNATGEKVLTVCLAEDHCRLPVQADVRVLSRGLYWLEVKASGKPMHAKFIKR
jgi:PKD repeat protein